MLWKEHPLTTPTTGPSRTHASLAAETSARTPPFQEGGGWHSSGPEMPKAVRAGMLREKSPTNQAGGADAPTMWGALNSSSSRKFSLKKAMCTKKIT